MNKRLAEIIRLNKQLRVIGFDDAPFKHQRGSVVNIAGIVCSNTTIEGMLWCEATKDGTDGTKVILDSLINSKFYQQVHAVLIDGITVGGFNVIDLPLLARELDRPCIAVMRKHPNLTSIQSAMDNFIDGHERWQLIVSAGKIYKFFSERHNCEFYYQMCGCTIEEAANVLEQVTDNGNVPEALRLAHLIGSAFKTGQSSNSA